MANKPAKELAKKPTAKVAGEQPRSNLQDRDEDISQMEPMLISESSKHRDRMNELVFELSSTASAFRASLPEGMVEALCDLVRSMNCYYSNRIEGHDTLPIEIEQALVEDYSQDKERRDLQYEAKAHIATQRWIDEGALTGRSATASAAFETHDRFESALPPDLLWVTNPKTQEREQVIPGEARTFDVQVGRHRPVSPGAINRFMRRWEAAYGKLSKFDTVLQAAAAHHRLVWVHPFADGNGRVTRLISYAMLLEALNSGGLWSIARGLSRSETAYKGHLAACDLPKRNDLDGRGALSEETLAEFTTYFLGVCLDQVQFMTKLMQPNVLRKRIMDWAKEEERLGGILPHSTRVLAHILSHRELERKDVTVVIGVDDRKARRVTALLHKRGIITATTHRAPFRIALALPAAVAPSFMPGLYPRNALPDRPPEVNLDYLNEDV
jgi:Fic family protein